MKILKSFILSLLLGVFLPVSHGASQKLTREQVIEFNTRYASEILVWLQDQERAIAAVAHRDVAIFSAAGAISILATHKKESGNLNQQQISFVMAVALNRLATLAREAGLPAAVTQCHLAEAQSLLRISKGQPPVILKCRIDAYGSDILVKGLNLTTELSWKPIKELTDKWANNALSYGSTIGEISQYGAEPLPHIQPAKPLDPSDHVSMKDMFEEGNQRDKIAICAPVLYKFRGIRGLGISSRVDNGNPFSQEQLEALSVISHFTELLAASAKKHSKQAYDKAWRDSSKDPQLIYANREAAQVEILCANYTGGLIRDGFFSSSEIASAQTRSDQYLEKQIPEFYK